MLFNVEFSFRILQYIFSNLPRAYTEALLEQFRFVEQQFQHMHDLRESGDFVCRNFIRTVDDQIGALREAMIRQIETNDPESAAHLSQLTRIRPPSQITSANELAVCVVDAAKQCQVSLGRSAVLLDVDDTLLYSRNDLNLSDAYNEPLVVLVRTLPRNVDAHLFTDMSSTDLQRLTELDRIVRPQLIHHLVRVGMVITPADILPADMDLDVLAQFMQRTASSTEQPETLLDKPEFASIKAVVDTWRAGGITGEPGRAWEVYMRPAFEAFYADHAVHYNDDRTARNGFAADTAYQQWHLGERQTEIDKLCKAFDAGRLLASFIAAYLNCGIKDLAYRVFLLHAQQRGYRSVCLFDDRESVRQGVELVHRAHGGKMELTCVPVDCKRDSAETYAAAMQEHWASIADPHALRQYFLTDPQLADLYIRGQILGALYRARDGFAALQPQQPQPRAGGIGALLRSVSSAVFARPAAPGPDTIMQQWIDRFQSCATIDEYYRNYAELFQYVYGVFANQSNPEDQAFQQVFGDLCRTINQVPSQWQYNRLVNTYNPICVMNPNIIFSGTENLAIASLVCHSWRENIKESDRTVHTVVPGHLSQVHHVRNLREMILTMGNEYIKEIDRLHHEKEMAMKFREIMANILDNNERLGRKYDYHPDKHGPGDNQLQESLRSEHLVLLRQIEQLLIKSLAFGEDFCDLYNKFKRTMQDLQNLSEEREPYRPM